MLNITGAAAINPSAAPEPAPPGQPRLARLRLGRCTLDLAAGELFDDQGQLAGLRRQALDLLLVLGRRAGQVVSKDELMSQVWPKVVVGEGSLTQAIADVRRVLGDEQHRLVRTVARRGYLLVPDEQAPAPEAARTTPTGWPMRCTATWWSRSRACTAAWSSRGSLRQEGTRTRLVLALIDGETGVQRWADSFDTERAQLAQAVGDFAVAIERTLVGALYRSTVERRAALSPAEASADDLAMQGYALWYRGVSRDNVQAARDLFERALALDPDSPRAWAGIQFTTANQLLNGWTDDRAATARRAEEAVANLERVDRDGSPTYSAKTFKLFQQRDFPAMLQVTTEWSQRYRLPLAFGAHGAALALNGRFDEAVPVLERALRLGPRDPFRAEWQYRLALAHFGGGRYELARDWSQTAANTNARLVWPPIHAAALMQLGRREAAQQAFDEHMDRHPSFSTAQVVSRLPSQEPGYAEVRQRMIASLRELGLRD